MKEFPFGKADLLLLIVSLVFIQIADCELCDPIDNNEVPYLEGSFLSLSEHNRTLRLLQVHEDNIYLAGNNAVFHLSGDLGTVRSKSLTEGSDNIYKILAVSEAERKLVSCISGNSGSCEFRELSNVNQTSPFREDALSNTVSPADYTSVGLLAPNKDSNGESLYVANGVNAGVTAGAKPILERQLQKQYEDRNTNVMSSSVHSTFVIRYSGAFVHEGFVYFLASQREVAGYKDSTIIPKLSRVCLTESTFDAFTEIELGCTDKMGNVYSISQSFSLHGDRLFVVFNENTLPENEINPGSRSALCIYNMTVLEGVFRDAVDACGCDKDKANNNNYLHLANCNQAILTSNPSFCEQIKESIRDNLVCDTANLFKYPDQRVGQPAVTETAVLERSNATFSSVTIAEFTADRKHTVALVGTKEGNLLKANLNGTDCLVYETVTVGSPILDDTVLVNDDESLLVLTSEKVVKMKVFNCSQFDTCDECIRPGSSLGDPYCGWCTLEKRCTRYAECPKNSNESRWLPYDDDTCAAITAVTPPSLAVDEDLQLINLMIAHLPALAEGESYECRFNDVVSQAEVNEGTLQCVSPEKSQLPPLGAGEDSVNVKLHVHSTETGINFVTTDYRFYDCSAIKSCSLCVSNEWECDWCKYEHRCSHDSSTCEDDEIIRGAYSITDGSEATDSCPQIIPQETKYIPTEVRKSLTFQAKNLPLPESPKRGVIEYTCQLKAMNPPDIEVDYMAEATLKTSDNITFNVTCGQQEYTYNRDMPFLNTSLTLKWKTENKVDGSHPVRLYKCSSTRPDCSRCLSPKTTPEELNCVWCPALNKCTAVEKCQLHVGRGGACPAPKIQSVNPQTAPLGGGTRVTVKGRNLGKTFEDITSITLVGEQCSPVNDSFKVGESITCIAGPIDQERAGNTEIIVEDLQGSLPDSFEYRDPQITAVSPRRGPLSGGTTVKIAGVKLDTGSSVEVYIGPEMCLFMNKTATNIFCMTADSKGSGEGSPFQATVNVTFDETVTKVLEDAFSFEKDPDITGVTPQKAIKSGGIKLTVKGSNLDLIQNPKVIAKRNDVVISTATCTDVMETMMYCPSPPIPEIEDSRKRRQIESEDKLEDVELGFILDGVKSAENWTRDNNVQFEIFRDPSYEKFENYEQAYKKGTQGVEITGSNIDTATSEGDVKVYIGTEECIIEIFSDNHIFCRPPKSQPAGTFKNESRTVRGLPFVLVKHGRNLEFEIGYLRYVWDPTLFIIIAICTLLIVIVLIAFVIICCLRKSKNKEVERLILELTNVRIDISEELRELFAMLQTAMHKFETNPEGLPVLPLIERSEYVKNMLFLNLNVQPTTEHPMAAEVVDAMRKFSELINNKSFLLVFIRTLDKEKSLPMMDRICLSELKPSSQVPLIIFVGFMVQGDGKGKVNIASLITLSLLLEGKLDYLTDVMVTLMSEEIEDIVEKGRPRQLCRRNESIVEKLVSNWVAICLYDYLESTAAEKIAQLYGAIQCVIEKGPIDAVSGKSQFSLSDEHMLESRIQFEEVKLQVVANEEDGEIASVTVLNVDTVTQVKNKILDHLNRGRPYSSRPVASDMDLEWRQGVSGQLVLRDEGADSEVKDGWKKINTLRDYRVGNDCRVALIKKQAHPNATLADRSDIVAGGGAIADNPQITETSFLQRCFCNCCSSDAKGNQEANYLAEKVPLHRSPTLVEATVEDGVSLWHLIKETEGSDDIQHKSKSKRRLQKKEIKEVLLPLLPATRTALQKYVDGSFEVMLSADQNQVPKSIKYLFDFFDRQATKYSVDASEVVNAWKNNVLPLRFWTTIMANPTYIFDLRRSRYVEACLRVLVQVLRDACSKSDFKLNKDFSPSRLLYASLLPTYTDQVERYYKHIQDIPRLNPDATKEEFAKICKPFENIFDRESTLFQLYQFAKRFNESLNAALEEDDDCQNANLVYRMEQVGITLNE